MIARPLLSCLAGLLAAACLGREPGAEHEITAPGDLLRSDGSLREAGWARRQLLRWDPAAVADPERLRAWDFFSVVGDEVAVNVTMADLGFAALASVGVLDLRLGRVTTAARLRQAGDRFELSPSLAGETRFVPADAASPVFEATAAGGWRRVRFDLPAGLLGPAASGELAIEEPTGDYLSLATPFAEDPRLFFFEQKVPGLRAAGRLTIDGREHVLERAWAFADWGRGVWPREVLWRWGGGVEEIEGRRVAFNLGNGFGDMRAASENLVTVDGAAFKLGRVDWSYDPARPLAPWRFRDGAGRVDLVLEPSQTEPGGLDLGAAYQRLLAFRGTLALPDGRRRRDPRRCGGPDALDPVRGVRRDGVAGAHRPQPRHDGDLRRGGARRGHGRRGVLLGAARGGAPAGGGAGARGCAGSPGWLTSPAERRDARGTLGEGGRARTARPATAARRRMRGSGAAPPPRDRLRLLACRLHDGVPLQEEREVRAASQEVSVSCWRGVSGRCRCNQGVVVVCGACQRCGGGTVLGAASPAR